jgi:transposase-like protein
MPPANRHNPVRAKSSQSLYSVHEFRAEFPDDEACLQWLWRERYAPDGEHALCPKCEQVRSFKRYATTQQRQSFTCTACGHHLHPTAGTIYAKSSRPLTDWFYAAFLIASTRCGISAKQLERELGCNYRTAWRMLNLLRNRIMEQDDSSRLSGEVEADETFVGGKPRAGRPMPKNAHWDRKAMVFGAVERGGSIKAEIVANSRASLVQPKVREFVVPGSMLFTDDYHGYKGLAKRGYRHRRINHSARIYVDGNVHTQTIEGFFGLFKTGVRGTHHAISKKWLQGYLNEWVWRYNHRFDDEAMFRQLLSRTAFQS